MLLSRTIKLDDLVVTRDEFHRHYWYLTMLVAIACEAFVMGIEKTPTDDGEGEEWRSICRTSDGPGVLSDPPEYLAEEIAREFTNLFCRFDHKERLTPIDGYEIDGVALLRFDQHVVPTLFADRPDRKSVFFLVETDDVQAARAFLERRRGPLFDLDKWGIAGERRKRWFDPRTWMRSK